MTNEDRKKGTAKVPESRTEATPSLDERLQAHIGSRLKSMYDSYLNEPIPDRLVELLEQLDQVSKNNPPADPSGKRGKPTG